jgi:hypothetical protein
MTRFCVNVLFKRTTTTDASEPATVAQMQINHQTVLSSILRTSSSFYLYLRCPSPRLKHVLDSCQSTYRTRRSSAFELPATHRASDGRRSRASKRPHFASPATPAAAAAAAVRLQGGNVRTYVSPTAVRQRGAYSCSWKPRQFATNRNIARVLPTAVLGDFIFPPSACRGSATRGGFGNIYCPTGARRAICF